MSLASDPVFQSYLITVTVLSFNVFGLANATAYSRGQAVEVINPEDKKLNDKATVVYDEGNDKTQRYRRAHRNALENVPIFMITALLLVLVQPSAMVANALFGVFAVVRIMHSFCYVKGIQPFRTIAFVIGLLTQMTMLGFILYYAFT